MSLSSRADGALAGARVAVVNWRDLEHSRAGGSERYAWECALALRDAGARVQFLTARERGQARRSLVEGIEIRRGGGTLAFYGWVAARLLRDRRSLDAVIDVENGIPQFVPLVVGRRCSTILVMHHVHQDQFALYFPAPVAWLGRFLERHVMPRVYRRTRTIAVSPSTRLEMRRRLGWRGPIDIVRNGTNVAPRTVAAPPSESGERLLVLGRLVPHKRVDAVIDAMPGLLADRPGLRLDVVGRGMSEELVRRRVSELGLTDSVTVHGFLPDQQLHELVRRSRLHVCASDAEGWGLVVLEVAAHGVPTVARDVPGLRDSILDGRTGWLLPDSGDPVAERLRVGILNALSELANDGRRDDMAEECRAWVAEHTWERMHGEVCALVEGEVALVRMRTGERRGTEGASVGEQQGPAAG